MRDPVAYFITWHTYGSWLRGQAPGAVDDDHNTPGEPFIEPDPARLARERDRINGQPIRLDASQRATVVRTVREVCAHHQWTLHAVHARTTHVHAVVSGRQTPERMMNAFKSWCTRRNRQHAGPPARLWSRHGSTRWLWTPAQMSDKIAYVLDGQGKPMARWPDSTDPRPAPQ